MKHFVLHDINPDKVNNLDIFLDEMNDISILITVANVPHISADQLEFDEGRRTASFKLVDDEYTATFVAKLDSEKVRSGHFEVFEGGRRLIDVSYTISDDKPIDLRAKLNCEGENLAKSEFERSFERDFSHESYQLMQAPLSGTELREKSSVARGSAELIAEYEQGLVESNDTTEGGEVTEDLEVVSDKVMSAIKEVKNIVHSLNNLCHDLTRGGTADFSTSIINSEILENGAIVEMIDEHTNGYKITFRKGTLDEMSEVSFFLEKEDELIFSVYISSVGNGKIASSSDQSKLILQKVRNHLV